MTQNFEIKRAAWLDGKPYASFEEAQRAGLLQLLVLDPESGLTKSILDTLVERKAEVLAILTLTDASRPKARGVKKPRKAKGAGMTELPVVGKDVKP